MAKKLIDENGEVLAELSDNDRILRASSVEYLKDTEVWEIEHFFKGNIDELKMITRELSTYARAALFSIIPYISYTDCCLKKDRDTLSFDGLQEICNISQGKLSEVLEELRKKDIICRAKNSRETIYFINPWIVCRGNRINRVLQTMFRNYRVRVINKTWKEIISEEYAAKNKKHKETDMKTIWELQNKKKNKENVRGNFKTAINQINQK
jgi:DNA-binding transcriptional regulator GbsR (MarR family)